MLEEKDGYFTVTDDGKKEFTLQSTASRSNQIIVGIGIVLVAFTFLVELQVIPFEGTAVLGVALIFLGAFLSMLSRANRPELPIAARVLLKELKKLN